MVAVGLFERVAFLKVTPKSSDPLGNDPLKASALKEQKRNIDFYFDNCETLQMKYPDGVPEGHPAYRPGLDRNRNGWACEPTPR